MLTVAECFNGPTPITPPCDCAVIIEYAPGAVNMTPTTPAYGERIVIENPRTGRQVITVLTATTFFTISAVSRGWPVEASQAN